MQEASKSLFLVFAAVIIF